jgi:hypothetical protein
MASALNKSVANLKKKLGEIEDPKVRKGVTNALRQVQKAIAGKVEDMSAAFDPSVPWT